MTNSPQSSAQNMDERLLMNWLKMLAPALSAWYTDNFWIGLLVFFLVSTITASAVWYLIFVANIDPLGKTIVHVRTAICILAFVLLNIFGTNGWAYL